MIQIIAIWTCLEVEPPKVSLKIRSTVIPEIALTNTLSKSIFWPYAKTLAQINH
jgi:hypothetical protein